MVHLVFNPSEIDEMGTSHDVSRKRAIVLALKLAKLQIF